MGVTVGVTVGVGVGEGSMGVKGSMPMPLLTTRASFCITRNTTLDINKYLSPV